MKNKLILTILALSLTASAKDLTGVQKAEVNFVGVTQGKLASVTLDLCYREGYPSNPKAKDKAACDAIVAKMNHDLKR